MTLVFLQIIFTNIFPEYILTEQATRMFLCMRREAKTSGLLYHLQPPPWFNTYCVWRAMQLNVTCGSHCSEFPETLSDYPTRLIRPKGVFASVVRQHCISCDFLVLSFNLQRAINHEEIALWSFSRLFFHDF